MIDDLIIAMSKKVILPIGLKQGDKVGLISPSAPLAGLLPHRVEQGIRGVKSLGLEVLIGKSSLKVTGYTAGNAKERAQDINDFFRNNKVRAIMAMIGGNHSNQLLSYLDFDAIKRDPKPFIGYSDLTVLQLAIFQKTGLVTFYGPCLMTQFAENPEPLEYTKFYFERALFKSKPIGKIKPSQQWTDEVLDWFEKKDIERPRRFKPNKGWEWLRKGKAEGNLLGGCITSIIHLRGTVYWPDLNGSILFWEIPEAKNITEGEDPSTVDAYLTDLELSGVFRQISGMIIGRPYHYSAEQLLLIKKIIRERTRKYNFPILFNVDIGHTDPMITLPIGVKAELDSANDLFAILERGVR